MKLPSGWILIPKSKNGMVVEVEQKDLITCKDCKWWEGEKDAPYGYCHAIKHDHYTSNWEIWIRRRYKGDFYCADAEPREEGEQDDEES